MAQAAQLDAAAEVFGVREAGPGDEAFIADSWLRSAWDDHKRSLPKMATRAFKRAQQDWYQTRRPQVWSSLAKAVVLVAHAREDLDHIGGWLAIGPSGIDYVYVKHSYRGWGLAQLLAKTAGVELKR